MKKIRFVIALLVGIGVAVYYQWHVDSPENHMRDHLQIGRPQGDHRAAATPEAANALQFNLLDFNGDQVDAHDFKGKIVFLNFWTTWCPTCVEEMPAMERLHQTLNNKDFAIIAVNMNEPPARVKHFIDTHELTFTVLLDPLGEVARKYGVRAIPTTFIFDKAGNQIGSIIGARKWDSRTYIRAFEKLIKK